MEGLEVVEGAGHLVKELPQEGGAAAPGGGHQEVPHLAARLGQPRHPDINIRQVQLLLELGTWQIKTDCR